MIYFVPPQIWAWARWRVKKMRRLITHVLSALPFEHEWLTKRGVSSTYIGHPYFDELAGQTLDATFLDVERARPGRRGRHPAGIAKPGSDAEHPRDAPRRPPRTCSTCRHTVFGRGVQRTPGGDGPSRSRTLADAGRSSRRPHAGDHRTGRVLRRGVRVGQPGDDVPPKAGRDRLSHAAVRPEGGEDARQGPVTSRL